MIDKRIGKRIKQYRKQRRYTQEQLAEKMDVSANYISRVERGVVFLSCEKLIALINTLEISANEIFIDVLDTAYDIKTSVLSEDIRTLLHKEQHRILSFVENLVRGKRDDE